MLPMASVPIVTKAYQNNFSFGIYVFNISYYQWLHQGEPFLSHSHSVLSLWCVIICVSTDGVKYDSTVINVPWVLMYFVYFVCFCNNKAILRCQNRWVLTQTYIGFTRIQQYMFVSETGCSIGFSQTWPLEIFLEIWKLILQGRTTHGILIRRYIDLITFNLTEWNSFFLIGVGIGTHLTFRFMANRARWC